MKCPLHKTHLEVKKTKDGPFLYCPVAGCEVGCWPGPTSLPADNVTRQLRHQCHLALDPLWQEQTRFKSRKDAYIWLAKTLRLHSSQAHVGMLSEEQCRQVLREIERLVGAPSAHRGRLV